MTTKLEQAARQAFSFCEEISSFLGKYPYVNGTEIVADARQVSASLREALDHSADAGKMIGCAYCNNPLFAGTKCNNCGRVTLAEQAEQEPVASVRWGRYKECEWTATERLHELLGRFREGQTPLQLYAAPIEPVKQEPVAYRIPSAAIGKFHYTETLNGEEDRFKKDWQPLYAAPVKTKDLTDTHKVDNQPVIDALIEAFNVVMASESRDQALNEIEKLATSVRIGIQKEEPGINFNPYAATRRDTVTLGSFAE